MACDGRLKVLPRSCNPDWPRCGEQYFSAGWKISMHSQGLGSIQGLCFPEPHNQRGKLSMPGTAIVTSPTRNDKETLVHKRLSSVWASMI